MSEQSIIENNKQQQSASNATLSAKFISAFRHHPAGVAVITADAGEGPVGLTATSVASVNADPPMLVFSASGRSSSTPTILAAETLVVHLLDERDISIAQLCATSGVNRFRDTSLWDRLPTGEPRFHVATSWMRVHVLNTIDAEGSHVIVAQVLECGGRNTDPSLAGATRPLVYHARSWHALGEASKIA